MRGFWTSALVAVGCLLAAPGGTAAAAPLGQITQFALPGSVVGIAAGPDGNMWFTEQEPTPSEQQPAQIGRITPSGQITQFPLASFAGPWGIAAGPDGNMWFTEDGPNKIGRITPSGTVTLFSVPTGGSNPKGIAAGPDGNMWFTEWEADKVGRITRSGTITEFADPDSNTLPDGIAAAPDGTMWFAENGGGGVAHVTTGGTVSEQRSTFGYRPSAITAGPGGEMWVADELGGQIGRFSPLGVPTWYQIPTGAGNDYGSSPEGLTTGPDGHIWFSEENGNNIGELDPATGAITEFSLPANSEPFGVAAGPDGNIWFADNDGVGYVGTGAQPASLRAPSVTGSGQAGTQQVCQGDRWSDWAGQQPLASAYPYDGYQWLLDGSQIAGATSQTYTPASGDVGHRLTCTVTVTYALQRVTVSSTSAPVTVIAQSSGLTGAGGPQGAPGPAGAAGPAGARGPQGAAGKVEVVTCTTVKRTGHRHGRRVHGKGLRCRTRLVSGPVRFKTATARYRATLSRAGRTYATGVARTAHGELVTTCLRAARRLHRGRYTLTLVRRHGQRSRATSWTVTVR